MGFPSSWQCVGFSEIDKFAIQIYKKHFPNHQNYGNATTINAQHLPTFDLLCGGFPCQSFSSAGKRRGFQDTRGTLFFEIARILNAKKPDYLLLENVRGLLSHDQGATFNTILQELDGMGYDLQWQVLNSLHYTGQNRQRVYIFGHLRGRPRPSIFPLKLRSPIHLTKVKNSGKRYMACVVTRSPKSRRSPDMGFIYQKNRIRQATITEVERLQGFPDGWTEGVSPTQRWKVLGNAVTVPVIRDIIKNL